MAESQTRLLPAPQPLVERLGAEFFRGVPRRPGIYRMYDAGGDLIYVGKAVDLHARLASYRRTNGQSRKTVRLIHTAQRIEWEECASETEARLRENEWIRTHRPRFNRAGTWPASARYVVLETMPDGFRLFTTTRVRTTASAQPTESATPPSSPTPAVAALDLREARPDEATPEKTSESFGAFRGGPALALGAMARALWLAWNDCDDPTRLPHALTRGPSLRWFEARHPSAGAWIESVRHYFAAESDALLAQLVSAVPEPPTTFGRAYVALQIETLTDFYRRGPMQNRRLRTALAPAATLLAPEELDDFSVRVPAPITTPTFRPPP